MTANYSEQILFTTKADSSLFFIGNEESPDAYLSFRHKDENTIIAEHTIVSESLQGRGIARKLSLKLIEYARENELKIIPECSYVVKFFERNIEFEDVLA
ncbi:MAG: GNAT family N-acetyltransferase [Bacteroidales bacterium]|jgi:predicted GNAT family acetyltransferase|nr:GNAT family N-acetyltransferase [Bacteroidales bacterium]HOI31513.1 GNAT family N-acetyltransferase [Bacteroidales bacterium]